MNIKIDMLRCFVAVAQTGSLASAAARIGRSISAVSMTLKQLEDHLGQRLFEGERKNKLSPLGRYMLETAQSELVSFDNALRAIETFARQPQGLIRVASVPSIAAMVFPDAIARFAERHPNVGIELQDRDSPSILNSLLKGDFDIGIATATGALRGITQKILFEDSFGLVCAHDHCLAQKQQVTIEDLEAYPFVQNELCAEITSQALQDLLTKTSVSARNTLSLIAMLRAKPWVTVLPRSVVQIDPQKLVFREIVGIVQKRRVDLLYQESTTNSFVADFVQILEQGDWWRAG